MIKNFCFTDNTVNLSSIGSRVVEVYQPSNYADIENIVRLQLRRQARPPVPIL